MKRNKANTEKQCFMKWHDMACTDPAPNKITPPPHQKKKKKEKEKEQ